MRWLPIGSWEPHGSHLPYDTDTRIAQHLARRAASPTDLVLPAIPFGCSWEHRDLGDPVSLTVQTLAQVVNEIAASASDPLVIVNGHGGNQWLASLVQQLNGHGHPALLQPDAREWDRAYQAAGWPFSSHDDMHAGAMECSLLLAWDEGLLTTMLPPTHEAPDRPLFSAFGMAPYAPDGYIGYPPEASREAGQRAAHQLVADIQARVAQWTEARRDGA